MYSKHFFVAALLCGLTAVVMAQSESQASEILNKFPELEGKVNASDVESIKNKTQELFKEKCESNGGATAYTDAQKAITELPTCVKQKLELDDYEKLQAEIEAAKPNGAVDEVFKKYCKRVPEAKQCFADVTEATKKCFSPEEQDNLDTVYNITEQLAGFVCYKDGDRIALFIAEGGPECISSKKVEIEQCARDVFGDELNLNTDNITANSIPEINFGEKECKQLTELQTCVVTALEGCEAPTCANIVESLFKFARQATPCKAFGVSEAEPRSQVQDEVKAAPAAASSLSLAGGALLLAVAAALN